jgi:hypothetical protein
MANLVFRDYYEMPYALDLFSNGRSDDDEALPVSGPGEPLPEWLLEDWPRNRQVAFGSQRAFDKTRSVDGEEYHAHALDRRSRPS